MTSRPVLIGAAVGVLFAIVILQFGISGLILVSLLGLIGAIAGAHLSGQIDVGEILSGFRNKN